MHRYPDGLPHGPMHDAHGEIRFMTRSGGYVMCRRKGCAPFILSEKQWKKLSPVPLPAAEDLSPSREAHR